MTETLLVRAAGGSWEELRAQTTMPEGGVVDVFGEDIGPVLGSPTPIVVVACQPVLSTGTPDALCVDADGGVWIVQLALGGNGDALLPQLLAFGGALTGMTYEDFEGACTERGSDPLAEYVELRVGTGFHRASFEVAVTEALATGRLRLVAIVRESSPAAVQSMRFLNATGATGMLFEATSFASPSVSAVRATAIDVGGANRGVAASSAADPAPAPAPAAASGTEAAAATPAAPVAAAPAQAAAVDPIRGTGAAAFLAAVGRATDASTTALVEQLHDACASAFDEIRFEGSGADARMHAVLHGADGDVEFVTAGADGAIVVSFEALSSSDASWSIRAELCQGMERLLGADLGEVRKISQLNLTVAEHLMDATLMDAMLDLVRDAAQGVTGRAAAAA